MIYADIAAFKNSAQSQHAMPAQMQNAIFPIFKVSLFQVFINESELVSPPNRHAQKLYKLPICSMHST